MIFVDIVFEFPIVQVRHTLCNTNCVVSNVMREVLTKKKNFFFRVDKITNWPCSKDVQSIVQIYFFLYNKSLSVSCLFTYLTRDDRKSIDLNFDYYKMREIHKDIQKLYLIYWLMPIISCWKNFNKKNILPDFICTILFLA